MGENELQSAVVGAIEVYFDRAQVQFTHHVPYANQQGHGLNRYCGDILAVVDSAAVIVLEFKVLDMESGYLKEFKEEQFLANLRFEQMGVPIAYAYNTTDALPYFQTPRVDHPNATLRQVNRSEPSLLPGERPSVANHHSLLDWLRTIERSAETPTNGSYLFGQVLGAVMTPSALRNGVLALLYSVDASAFFALTDDQLRRVYKALTGTSRLLPTSQRTLERVLGTAAGVINRGFSQSPPGQAPTDDSSGPSP